MERDAGEQRTASVSCGLWGGRGSLCCRGVRRNDHTAARLFDLKHEGSVLLPGGSRFLVVLPHVFGP